MSENLLHHVRDRTFREDDSEIYVGRLPSIMAGLRNPAIGVHRQDHTNIAAALRHTARAPSHASALPPREMQGQDARSHQVKNRQVGAARTA
ncbi:hypothetical protein [Streptomyces sp. NPDC046985]|uniref:hypothetical protein n=1 Tax=Streptomyces sp. NPDC046985 TaxID=3155377 RepID=UPI0033D5CD06